MKLIIFIVFFKADGWTDVMSVQVSHLSLISQFETVNISSADILGNNLLKRPLQPMHICTVCVHLSLFGVD